MTLIGRFLTGTYKVTRMKSGTYVKGRYIPGPTEELQVDGSMQPVNARELKLPEEGNRLRQYWKFFTDQKIVVNSMATLADGDIITIDGDEYRAMSLFTWENVDLEYHATIVWREPQQATDGKGATR